MASSAKYSNGIYKTHGSNRQINGEYAIENQFEETHEIYSRLVLLSWIDLIVRLLLPLLRSLASIHLSLSLLAPQTLFILDPVFTPKFLVTFLVLSFVMEFATFYVFQQLLITDNLINFFDQLLIPVRAQEGKRQRGGMFSWFHLPRMRMKHLIQNGLS